MSKLLCWFGVHGWVSELWAQVSVRVAATEHTPMIDLTYRGVTVVHCSRCGVWKSGQGHFPPAQIEKVVILSDTISYILVQEGKSVLGRQRIAGPG
jgi:hypothetical protein